MNFVGYTPAKHQRVVHTAIANNPTASVFVVVAPRQTGKTMLLMNELLRCSINNRNAVSLCISITLDASRKIYKELTDAIEGTGVVKKKNDSLLTLEFITGSIIYFRSGEQRDSLRGLTIKNGGLLIVDECSYQNDDFFYSVLLPMTNVYKADILLTSTPRFKQGFFFKYYSQGKDGAKNIYSFNFADYDLSRFITPLQKELYRQVMPKAQYQTEILGEFLDADSVLFEGFRECVNEERKPLEKVYIGIDWSAGVGVDRTSISILNQDGQQIHLEYFNDKNTTQTVDRIEAIYQQYRKYSPVIYAETNGVGKPYCDLLKDRKIQINEWTTTNKSKTDMVSHLQVAFEQKQLALLPDELQMNELSYYEATYNPKTQVVTYNAPQGLHDDTVISLGLSWEAYRSRAVKGVYSLGVVRNHF
jgi:hypothetical protein